MVGARSQANFQRFRLRASFPSCLRILSVASVVVWIEDPMKESESPRAVKTASTFRMTCSITRTIHASPERLWALLTDAPGFSRWNSTVTRIGGKVALGEKLAIEVPAAPGRTFKPKVTEFEPGARMVWSDGAAPMFKGVRTYTLEAAGDGATKFSMTEVFSGVMLPLIRGSLPDFAPVFETYAADLKREAERSS
jgi:hypothetical protein